MIRTLTSVLVVATIATPAAAAPAAPPAPRSAVVSYGDLDLRNPADARTMLLRLRAAAADVCGRTTNGFAEIARYRACYQATMVKTVSKLKAPAVTAALNLVPFHEPRSTTEGWASLKP